MKHMRIKHYRYKKNDNTLKNLMIIMFLGSILGSLFSCLIDKTSIEKLSLFIDSFIDINNNISFNFLGYFERVFKGLKYFIFIWFLAFIMLGDIFIYLVIFAKGFFMSFTTAIFFSKYSLKGLTYIFNTYIIENIVIVCLIFYIAYSAIKYYKDKNNFNIKSYILRLALCIVINLIFFILY